MARRIVTGNNEQGRSYVVSDEEVPLVSLWRSIPGDPLGATADPPTRVLSSNAPHIEPSPGGSRVMLVTVRPEAEALPEGAAKPQIDPKEFHRTATIDYIMMVSGEIVLLLDEDEITARAGDLIVQRNTNHSWRNRTGKPTEFWAVMVSLAPP